MTAFVLRSSLDVSHRSALERLMYFNPRQHEAEIGIADAFAAPSIFACCTCRAAIRRPSGSRHRRKVRG